MEAVINTDDDDLHTHDDPDNKPGWARRLIAALCRPLIPLANRALRHRYEVEQARHATDVAAERRKRVRAETECDAAKQEKETLALMHARIVAKLTAEIAVFNATTKRAGAE